METPRLDIPPGLRAAMDYPKMRGDALRMLVLESHYWVDQSCMQAATNLGWEVARTPVVMEGQMPREMVASLLKTLVEFKPDFILSANLSGMDTAGLFAGLFTDFKLPYVAWFVDDPRTIIMDKSCFGSPYGVAASWEAAYLPYLDAAGFGVSMHLPLAVDPILFHGTPPQSADLPPAFVGNSMRAFAAREWAWFEDQAALAQPLIAAFEEGRVTREAFGQGLDTIFGAEAWAAMDAEARRHLEMICFIEGTRRKREALVTALAPEGLRVYGDQEWQAVTPACGPWIDYKTDLPDHYRNTCVNLNTTSIQMAATVNQRVFDCPAAGGFLLTDAQAGLPALLEPEAEIATYASLEEAQDKVRYYRAHPQVRRAMVQRAQTRIAAEHTYHHRLQSLAAVLRKTYG